MTILDYILSFVFLFELLIKVVVLGFAFNGEDSYLKNIRFQCLDGKFLYLCKQVFLGFGLEKGENIIKL